MKETRSQSHSFAGYEHEPKMQKCAIYMMDALNQIQERFTLQEMRRHRFTKSSIRSRQSRVCEEYREPSAWFDCVVPAAEVNNSVLTPAEAKAQVVGSFAGVSTVLAMERSGAM